MASAACVGRVENLVRADWQSGLTIERSSPLVGVVGGAGQMGRWLRRFWRELGHEVIWSDRDGTPSNEDIARRADLTFVAIPLDSTPGVLRALAPLVPPRSALVSIASLMAPSAEAMAELTGEGICAHPVFGPTVTRLAGLPVVIAPVRGERWSDWLAATLTAAGLRVRMGTPAEHDRHMAVVQALLHSLYVALVEAMSAAGLPPEAALDWASPTLRMQLGLMARILGQDARLYADLVVGNPDAPDRLDDLADALHRLAALARAGEREGFAAAFRAAHAGLGAAGVDLAAHAEEALERFT